MRNIKLMLSYDGTRYSGWQRQDHTDSTIQGKLEALLSKMTGEEIVLHGSGRTDGGVHARGQVANFHTESKMATEEMLSYMKEYLPMDIAVLEIKDASLRFHSRLHVKRKVYSYHIWNSPIPNVFLRKYSYQVEEPLALLPIREAAGHLLGTHDFKSFCSRKKTKKSTVRTLEDIRIEKQGDEIIFIFTGSGFLYHMARLLTGTLIEVGLGRREPDSIPLVIEAKDREQSGFLAPAHGLFLERAEY